MDPTKLAEFLGAYGAGIIDYVLSFFNPESSHSTPMELRRDDGRILVMAFIVSVLAINIHYVFLENALISWKDLVVMLFFRGLLWLILIFVGYGVIHIVDQDFQPLGIASAILRVVPVASLIATVLEIVFFWTLFSVLKHDKAVQLAPYAEPVFQAGLVAWRLPPSLKFSGVTGRRLIAALTSGTVTIQLFVDIVFMALNSGGSPAR